MCVLLMFGGNFFRTLASRLSLELVLFVQTLPLTEKLVVTSPLHVVPVVPGGKCHKSGLQLCLLLNRPAELHSHPGRLDTSTR